MDRFEWLQGQCWLDPWPAASHAPQNSSAVDWVFRGTASFHVSQQEQYGDSASQASKGPLAADARHLFFKTGPECHDPTETACCLGVVQRSVDERRLLFCLADHDKWEIDTSQVQRLVLRDSEASTNQERPEGLPACLSVIFRHVVLNLYDPSPTTAAEARKTLSGVAGVFARAAKAGRSTTLASGGKAAAQQTARPEELARDWLRSVGELGAAARSAGGALAATEIVEGALAQLAATAVTHKEVREAARDAVRSHLARTDAEEEVVRWLLENRGKDEGIAAEVTAKLQGLLRQQKQQYGTHLWLQVVGTAGCIA